MRLLVSGSSGFVGSALSRYLRTQGHDVVSLVRKGHLGQGAAIVWDPEQVLEDMTPFEGFDGVIHLAGERLTLQRWTQSKRKKIFHSRVDGTRHLVEILASLERPPKVFISASAVGIYGDRGDTILDETSSLGSDFLAGVCRQWEAASSSLSKRGIRTVQTRFGIVLGSGGGALQTLLPVYRYGLGAILGSGKQWVSWIALDDLVRSIAWILETDLAGPVNVVAPHALQQKDFAKALGKAVHRPVLWKIPAWILKLVLKEMAEEMLLASAHVVPTKLLQSNFCFQKPSIISAL
jgi:uncharacterized protein (TIGR01777 family)